MGRERDCKATIGGKTIEGRALLETDEVIFRSDGAKPLRLKFASLRTIEAKNGKLVLDDVAFALGDDAPKWADAIKNPKGRIQKLGVKPGQKIAALSIDDESFLTELQAVVPEASTTLKSELDILFFGASTKKALDRLATLKAKLASNGALWIVRPKGVAAITEADVRSAGLSAGLVDVKVVKFSETHTAEKFVIPVAKRR